MKSYLTINLTIVIIALIFNLSNLSSKEITGKVTGNDNGKITPLRGARVALIGTELGAITNEDGSYAIDAKSKPLFVKVTYTGYLADSIKYSDKLTNYDFELKLNPAISDEVIVTESRPSQITESGLQQSQLITLSGLRKAACCNLAESFETNPSVDVSFTDAVTGARQIQLLGLNQVYSQMMTEKHPNLRGAALPFGLSFIPGSWMESIQISKGASSVADGFESVTGQINVEYKKPFDSELLFFNLYGNNMGRIEGNLNSSYIFEEGRSGATIFAHGSMNQLEIDNNNDGFLDLPKLNQLNLMSRWRFYNTVETENDLEGNIGARVVIEDRIGGQKGFDPDISNTDIYGIEATTRRYELMGKLGYVLPSDSYKSLAMIYQLNFHDQESYFGRNIYNAEQLSGYVNAIFATTLFNGNDDDHSDHENGTEELGDFHSANHKLNIGLNYQYDQFNELTNDTAFIRTESIPGLYGEYTYSGSEWLTLSAGLRADFHNLFGTFITPRFHSKIKVDETLHIRASAGKGWRSVNLFIENQGLFASSRQFFVTDRIMPEEAWNYGVNATYLVDISSKTLTINVEYYRTDFQNQMVVDMDRDPLAVYFYNLKGKSYSNSFQIDAQMELFRGFELFAAYRLNDIKQTIGGELLDKPLVSRHKAFLNLAYATRFDEWQFDWTLVYNGSGRFADTRNSPEEFRLQDRFDPFITMNAQITKQFGSLHFYIGGENLTNFIQPNAIVNANNPYGNYFDTSYVYGPIAGRMIYAGFRYELY